MENKEFNVLLQEKTRDLNVILEKFLPAEEGTQKTVLEAMNYSVRAGGKRLRPMFLWETYLLCGGNEEDRALVEPFETAVKSFTYAGTPEKLKRAAAALEILAGKAGIYGMIGGQTADIEAEGKKITEELLLFIHEHKTAALIQSAMTIGAVLAGAETEQVQALEKCAYNIGIAFQIQDDILDVTGDSSELGKAVGSDAQNDKQTYVTLNGLEKAEADVAALSEEAVRILDSFAGENPFLRQLILELIHRRK